MIVEAANAPQRTGALLHPDAALLRREPVLDGRVAGEQVGEEGAATDEAAPTALP